MAADTTAPVSSDEAVAALYALPLAEFTPGRNDLSKRLRGAGDKQAAAEVKGLRKPSITAWALNQLPRRRAGDVDALLEAADELRAAHARALAGDGSTLRGATRAYQERVGELTRLAVSILDESGSAGANHAERLMESLWAPATDEEAGRRLREGRLTEELERTAFGLPEAPDAAGNDRAASPAPPATRKAPARKAAGTTAPGAEGPATTAPAEEGEQAAAERRAVELAAARAEERARAEAQVASARLAAAQRRSEADGAAERAGQLAGEATRAAEVAVAARQASDEAEQAAETAGRQVAAADAAVVEAEERLRAIPERGA